MKTKSQIGKPDDPRPLYVQIKETLRRDILSGHIRDKLTGEIELAQQLGTSRGTVQQAINALVQEGLLHRHRGLGTFVNAERVEGFYREISSFTGAMKAQGLSPIVKLQQFRTEPASPEQAALLSLSPGEEVYFYSRTVDLDDVPIVLTWSDIPAARFPGLSITRPGESLYKILRQEFGVTPFRARDSYTAELATGEVAQLLQLAEGSPVFRVARITFDHAGQPIEHAVSWFNKGKLTVEISPMSLFLEEQFYSGSARTGQWHHHVVSEY
jgi:GntR family transcriptional regulator